MDFSQALERTVRFCVERDAVPQLVAASFDYDEGHQHLRVSYFLEGPPQDIDFERLDLGMTEILSAIWQAVQSSGVEFIFDDALLAKALLSPAVVYKR